MVITSWVVEKQVYDFEMYNQINDTVSTSLKAASTKYKRQNK